jgi:hypothetical protein
VVHKNEILDLQPVVVRRFNVELLGQIFVCRFCAVQTSARLRGLHLPILGSLMFGYV